jgi:REP element-mobilizing transposase RayT
MQIKTYYRNNLPHITPIGATFFITFRLGDSLPQPVLWKLKKEFNAKIAALKRSGAKNLDELIYKEQKRFFGKYDKQLDENPYGSCLLKSRDYAEQVIKQMTKLDGNFYELQAYTIMPNHVHFLIDTMTQLVDENNLILHELPLNFASLADTMQRVKGASAYYSNLILKEQTGKKMLPFFQHESFDHYVRDEQEWGNIVAYILNNPVKAGLVDDWRDWKFSYCKYI